MSVEELHQTPPAESGGVADVSTDQNQEQPPSLRDTIGDAAAGDDRVYVRDGRRFVAKMPKEEADAAAAAQTAQAPWRPLYWKDEFGDFGTLSEAARKAIEAREREAGKYQSETGQKLKSWEPLSEALKPFENELRMNGQSPQQFLGGLVNIYSALQQNPVEAINWLCQQRFGAGVDIRAVADWLDQQDVQPQQIDPLEQEVARLRTQIQQLSQYPQQQQRQALDKQIADWSQGKEHFEAVRSLMASLAQSNPSANLDQLYDMACHAHPEVRPRMLEAQRAASAAKARDANALNVRGTPGPGAPDPATGLGLRDQIKAAMSGRI